MALRHRLFGGAARRVVRGVSITSQAVFMAWFWTLVLPVILMHLLTRPRHEDEERGDVRY